MPATRNHVWCICLALPLAACQHDAALTQSRADGLTALMRPTQPQTGYSAPSQSAHFTTLTTNPTPTVAEEALIDSIIALHPPEAAPTLRRVLHERNSQLQLPSNPRAQALLNRLAATRISEAAAVAPAGPPPVDATIAIVDKLPDESADAVVLRRKDAQPHDVILLASGNATQAAMGAGIQALFRMRKAMGDIPSRDARTIVHKAAVPAHWTGSMLGARAASDLTWLRGSQPRHIMGLGPVRALDIPLIAMDGR